MKAKFRDESGNVIRPVRPNFNMHPDMYRAACELASRLGKSFTDLVCDLITEALQKEKHARR